MSALGRRIAKIETVWQRSEPPRVLCVERTPDGRLVLIGTDDEVEPRAGDTVIVFTERPDGPQ